MRMIVDAFKDTLELGLEKPKQVVVRFHLLARVPNPPDRNWEVVRNVDISYAAIESPSLSPLVGCMTKRAAPCDGLGWALPAHAGSAAS
jgi:hypothetical protein